jgi:hypothetical protein
MRVEVASRIHEPDPTGPVLKEGPIAALAEATAIAARTDKIWLEEGMLRVSYFTGWTRL